MSDVTIFAPSPTLTVTVEDHPQGAEIHVHAGGQGVWQARMLRRLGVTVTMCCVLTGEVGRVLRHLLEDEGVTVLAVERDGRGSAYVHDRREGGRVEIAEEEGDPLGRHVLDDLYGAVLHSGADSAVIILSGPAGDATLPADIYRRLALDLHGDDHVVVADLSGERLTAALETYFEDLAAAYESEHPDVELELIQETDQSIKDKTKTLTASSALPDIYFTWTGDWAENFVGGGLAADLSKVIGPGTEWGDRFGEASLSAFQYDGKYYGVPLYNNGKFMGYSKSAFAAAGVEVPTTFEDLIASCGPLRDAGYEPIAFGNKDGWPALHYLQQLFAHNVPSDVLHADFDPKTAEWTDEGYIQSLEQFETLVQECTDSGRGTNGVLYTTAQEALAGGRAAMYYQEILEFDTVTADGATLTTEDFGIFALPSADGAAGDPDAIEGSPEGYLINAKSPQAALAVDFMKFVTEPENASVLSSPPYGQPSTVVGAVTEDTSSPSVFEGITAVNEASQLVVWLDTVTVPEVADAWLAGGEAIISGSATPEEVLDSVRAANDAAK